MLFRVPIDRKENNVLFECLVSCLFSSSIVICLPTKVFLFPCCVVLFFQTRLSINTNNQIITKQRIKAINSTLNITKQLHKTLQQERTNKFFIYRIEIEQCWCNMCFFVFTIHSFYLL